MMDIVYSYPKSKIHAFKINITEASAVIETILVALDESDLSERVVNTIKELSIKPATKIVLIHVIPSINSEVQIAVDRPHTHSEELPYRQIEKQLQSYQESLSFQTEIEIVSGDPAEEIIRLANIHHADLIVIGSRGLTGMKRILMGSVSSQVVADAPCSVLVVKPESETKGQVDSASKTATRQRKAK